MQADYLDYRDTGYFSKTVLDYLDQHPHLHAFYNTAPQFTSFDEEIKRQQQKQTDRPLLMKVIGSQYQKLQDAGSQISQAVSKNILALGNKNCFTVTTGHQLNLFTGPLYTIYKILGTISLANKLSNIYPEHLFVPFFWMATEDHDFAEINHLNIRDKRLEWTRDSHGAVGRLSTKGIEATVGRVLSSIGISPYLSDLERIFRKAYLDHAHLADATRYFYNELFGRYGLVILDPDAPELKRKLAPIAKEDILNKTSYTLVSNTNKKLAELGYPNQVHPREINFFYLDEGIRERIIEKEGKFKVLNTDLEFSKIELEHRIDVHPEQFSPNVIMRPLYQELLLPNLAYIGGGAEVSYWLSLGTLFHHYKLPFPRLLLRNSALLADELSLKRLKNLGFSSTDIFKGPRELTNAYVKRFSEKELDLGPQLASLEHLMKETEAKASFIESTLGKSTRALCTRMLHQLKHLENKMLKTEKNKFDTQIAQLYKVHQRLFPNGSLQERSENFLPYYAVLGTELFDQLLEAFDPLGRTFTILKV